MPKFSGSRSRLRTLAYPPFHPDSRAPRELVLSLDEFRAAFPAESQHVEFKRGTSIVQLQSTAVAFSNAEGGVILIGVRDDGSIAARALDAGTQDDIHQAMQAARDVGRYSLHPLQVEAKPVCVVSIARSPEPCTSWMTRLACWARSTSSCCDLPTTCRSTMTAAMRSAVPSTTSSPRPPPASATI
jgi:hypothetical protein